MADKLPVAIDPMPTLLCFMDTDAMLASMTSAILACSSPLARAHYSPSGGMCPPKLQCSRFALDELIIQRGDEVASGLGAVRSAILVYWGQFGARQTFGKDE